MEAAVGKELAVVREGSFIGLATMTAMNAAAKQSLLG
jgi:hypothetical protein